FDITRSSETHCTLSLSRSGHHRDLHSFPTRRSSDLGDTPEVIEAVSWLGRGALAEKQADRAVRYAVEAQRLVGKRSPDEALRFKDRKSTRLNSSHVKISYAVFCLKKKKNKEPQSNSH